MSPQPARNELCAQMNPRGAVAGRPMREAPHIQAGRGGLFPKRHHTLRPCSRDPGDSGRAAAKAPSSPWADWRMTKTTGCECRLERMTWMCLPGLRTKSQCGPGLPQPLCRQVPAQRVESHSSCSPEKEPSVLLRPTNPPAPWTWQNGCQGPQHRHDCQSFPRAGGSAAPCHFLKRKIEKFGMSA